MLYGGGADITASSRTFWKYTGTAPSDATLAAMCGTLVPQWETQFNGLMGNSTVFFGLRLTDLTSPSAGRGQVDTSVAGVRGAGLIPFGAAAVIDMKINRRYRGGKARIYMPFGIDTDITGGYQWATEFTGAVDTAWALFTGDMLASGESGTTVTTQAAVSYYQGFTNEAYGTPLKYRRIPTLRGGGPLVDDVYAGVCAIHVGSQRRRNQAA